MNLDAPLYRLTYVSTVTQSMDTEAVDRLVEAARSKNDRLGITGILLFNGLNFLQTLEGPRDVVVQLFELISHDPRHNGVVSVQQDEPKQRSFDGWSMAYAPVGRAGAQLKSLSANGFGWTHGSQHLPEHLQSLYLAFNSLGKALPIAAGT